jgi:phosphatidylserine/phosphatidylglycerophosphate/cardiolipin synthase-like enzyme
MRVADLVAAWFLSAEQRGNPDTLIDRRYSGGLSWSEGNGLHALVHGAAYFGQLVTRLRATRDGDLVLFTDWRGDPDEHLDEEGSEVGQAFAEAARRGVLVRGLVWRSHLDKFQFSARENRHLGEEIDASGGECRLDMRVRPLGSHHQKLVVLRHPGRPERDVAFVGGIDLCHSRRDDVTHLGDPQAQPIAAAYGPRPPWHDIQLAITGPAVGDVEATFRERWEDPAPLSRNPLRLIADRRRGVASVRTPLPPQLPDPDPAGQHAVQVLRTYPVRRPGYPFARAGERSIARGYAKVFSQATQLIYLEDQYLWSVEAAELVADALRRAPDLRFIAVIPRLPDQDGRLSTAPNLVSRERVLHLLQEAGKGRASVYGLENARGTPVYVHAKVCAIDDTWVSVGSDNINRRSWTHDSEVTCAVISQGEGSPLARELRLQLAQEHLDLPDQAATRDRAGSPHDMFEAFAESARRLDAWHAGGRAGERPPGRLRTYTQEPLGRLVRAWSTAAYRAVYDPDGRSLVHRLQGRY